MDRLESRHWLRERVRGVGLVILLGLGICLVGYVVGVLMLVVLG